MLEATDLVLIMIASRISDLYRVEMSFQVYLRCSDTFHLRPISISFYRCFAGSVAEGFRIVEVQRTLRLWFGCKKRHKPGMAP